MTAYEPTEDEIEVLPCGCVVKTIVATRTVQLAPCRRDCVVLAQALEVARQVGRAVEYRHGP